METRLKLYEDTFVGIVVSHHRYEDMLAQLFLRIVSKSRSFALSEVLWVSKRMILPFKPALVREKSVVLATLPSVRRDVPW